MFAGPVIQHLTIVSLAQMTQSVTNVRLGICWIGKVSAMAALTSAISAQTMLLNVRFVKMAFTLIQEIRNVTSIFIHQKIQRLR